MSNLATLTEQKQTYVAERIAGKSKLQAALTAGYSESTATQAGLRVESPEVKSVFRALMQRQAPMAKLAERLAEGLDAVSITRAQFEGKFTDERKDPDYARRLAYAQIVAEYAGYVEKDGAALTVQIGSLSVAMPEGDAAMRLSLTPAQPVLDLAPDEVLSADVQAAPAPAA